MDHNKGFGWDRGWQAPDTLRAAMGVVGINNAASRGLTFHAWRHFFNTMMRSGGVPDVKVRAVTGHKTSAMMDHYTSFRVEDYADIIRAQEMLLSGPLP